jgi:hypothetical protein
LSLNLEFSYGLSFNLSDENEPLAYLSLNLVGHLSRDVCIHSESQRDEYLIEKNRERERERELVENFEI